MDGSDYGITMAETLYPYYTIGLVITTIVIVVLTGRSEEKVRIPANGAFLLGLGTSCTFEATGGPVQLRRERITKDATRANL